MFISSDVISSLGEYMIPLELYERKNLDRLWYQRYIEILPNWSLTAEPWFIAAQTGDIQLLEDLLSLADPPFIVSNKHTENERFVLFDGIEYTEDVYGIIMLAINRGKHDVALKLARTYEEQLFRSESAMFDILEHLALFDDYFLKKLVSDKENVILRLANNFRDTRVLLIRAYNKSFIDDIWILDIAKQIMAYRSARDIIAAYDFVYIYEFKKPLQPLRALIEQKYFTLERHAKEISDVHNNT